MGRRVRTRLALASIVVVMLTASLPTASAGGEATQTVSLTATLEVPYQLVELCLNDDCETLLLAGASRELALDLSYTLAASGHFPSVDTEVGTPTVCELKNRDGSITKRLGAAVLASGATFADRSWVRLSDGGKPVKHKTTGPGRPTKTDSVGASVCVLTTYP